jgi:very-short-patch-repair endonuclease
VSSGDSYVDPDNRGQRRNGSDDEVIARLASRQGGVVGRRQLVALGITAKAVDYRVGSGRLRVYYRGVYAVGHEAIQLRGRLVGALLVAGPGAALSHMTAAALHKLIPSMPPFVEVTTTNKAPRSRPGLLFHESKTIDVMWRHGVPLTTPARTLRDLAATRPYGELERACSEALVLGLVTSEALTAQSGPGSATLKRLAADGVAPTRSELERRFNRVMRKAGLPVPLANQDVLGEEIDFQWPEHRLIVEVDGWKFHGHRIAFERDRSRDAELQLGGYIVLRFTWRQLCDEPAAVAARVARFLNAPASRRAA